MITINKEIELNQLEEKVVRKILVNGESLMMVEVYFKKGGIGQAHSHEEHEQASYVVDGSFEISCGDEKKVLKSGDSFYADKNVEHGVKALEDGVILDIFTPIREDFLE
ncbi:MAG: cupin domain-containing protein [Firmicutes bacterium]|nr:cupin domain-containing protein [Bacillota bacterium]